MSFASLFTNAAPHPDANALKIGVDRHNVVFRLPGDALSKLGWAAKMVLDVQIGEGDDFGKVLLRAGAKGRTLQTAGGGSKALRLKVARGLFADAPAPRPTEAVRHELDGDAAIIAWLPWIEVAADVRENRTTETPGNGPDQQAGAGADPGADIAETSPPGASDHQHVTESSEASAGSSPAAGATFPIQTRSLAEVERTNDPATWPAEIRAEFIEAAGRRKPLKELARICGRNEGSIIYIINRYLKARVADKRQEYGTVDLASVEHRFKPVARDQQPAAPAREPPKPSPAPRPARMVPRDLPQGAEPASAKPTLPPELLKFLREEVAPVLLPLGVKITKNHDDTGLERNGLPVSLEAVIAEVNRIITADGEAPITFDTAA